MYEKQEMSLDKISADVLKLIWANLNPKALSRLACTSSFFQSSQSHVKEVKKAKSWFWQLQIAGGESNILILTKEGMLFGCGQNFHGHLGFGHFRNEKNFIPIVVKGLVEGEKIEKIALGSMYTLVLTNRNRLFEAGAQDFLKKEFLFPYQGNQFDFRELTIEGLKDDEVPKMIGVGESHAMVLTSKGRVFVRGRCYNSDHIEYYNYGHLGLGSIKCQESFAPIPIEGLKEGEVPIRIHVGKNNNLLLTSQGRLFGCGKNCDDGQLGLGHTDRQGTFAPIEIEGLHSDEAIADFYSTYNSSLILTSKGRLFGCGSRSYGQLGIDLWGPQTRFMPILIENLEKDELPVKLSVGQGYNFVLTSKKRLLGCGDNYSGQLGLGLDNSPGIYTEISINDLAEHETIEQIFAGEINTLVVTSSGNLWACGGNYDGELGLGHRGKQKRFMLCPPLPFPR